MAEAFGTMKGYAPRKRRRVCSMIYLGAILRLSLKRVRVGRRAPYRV